MTNQVPEADRPVVRVAVGSDVAWAYAPVGWAEILRETVLALDESMPGWRLRNAKAKFGGLDIYVNLPDDSTDAERNSSLRITRAARSASERTCEICSAPALQQVIDNWISVLCEEHADHTGQIPGVVWKVIGHE